MFGCGPNEHAASAMICCPAASGERASAPEARYTLPNCRPPCDFKKVKLIATSVSASPSLSMLIRYTASGEKSGLVAKVLQLRINTVRAGSRGAWNA
jgi:hypothetical protein